MTLVHQFPLAITSDVSLFEAEEILVLVERPSAQGLNEPCLLLVNGGRSLRSISSFSVGGQKNGADLFWLIFNVLHSFTHEG